MTGESLPRGRNMTLGTLRIEKDKPFSVPSSHVFGQSVVIQQTQAPSLADSIECMRTVSVLDEMI